jgi:hypothetical protein
MELTEMWHEEDSTVSGKLANEMLGLMKVGIS